MFRKLLPVVLVTTLGACGSELGERKKGDNGSGGGGGGDGCLNTLDCVTMAYADGIDSVTSVYEAGDCDETADFTANEILGPPDCTDCVDYCTTSYESTPCSWFSFTDYGTDDVLVATFTTPVADADQLRLWVNYAEDPLGDLSEVAVAESASGTFVALSGGTTNLTCSNPRTITDYSVAYDITAIDFSIGAVRLTVASWNLGFDAIALVTATD